MVKPVIEKGRYRVVPLETTRADGQPRGYYLEVKRGGKWQQHTFKSQRYDALTLFEQKAKVRI